MVVAFLASLGDHMDTALPPPEQRGLFLIADSVAII
jgi:hypothetical protein